MQVGVFCFQRPESSQSVLMARDFDRQDAELQVRAAVLNRFTRPGTPVAVAMP